jgi:TnpA family transposase
LLHAFEILRTNDFTTENTNIKPNYPLLKFTGTVNIDYLKKYADELKYVAASLQTGTVTASLFISKLQAYLRQNNLMYVLQSYGQLIKTIFICRYLLELPLKYAVEQRGTVT